MMWDADVTTRILASSPYGDAKEIAWYKQCSKSSVTIDDLVDSGGERFLHCDLILTSAILKILPASLVVEYHRKQQAYDQKGIPFKGRQAAWLVHNYFRTEVNLGTVYNYMDLVNCNGRVTII